MQSKKTDQQRFKKNLDPSQHQSLLVKRNWCHQDERCLAADATQNIKIKQEQHPE